MRLSAGARLGISSAPALLVVGGRLKGFTSLPPLAVASPCGTGHG